MVSRILAWDVWDELDSQALPGIAQAIDALRQKESVTFRPIVGAPESQLMAYSRHLDILVQSREPIGTSMEMGDYARWLSQRPQLCRPSIPHWATIQSQAVLGLEHQWAAFGFAPEGATFVEVRQLRQLAFAAIGAGMRGLHFRSRDRLDRDDQQQRAAALRMLNLELQIAEPWIAAGKRSTQAGCDDPQISAPVLRTDRAQLVVVSHEGVGDQYVGPDVREGVVDITVPGIPVGCAAYLAGYGGFTNLETERVAGGLRLTVPNAELPAMIVVTRDPVVVNSLSILLRSQSTELAALRTDLAKAELHQVRDRLERLTVFGRSEPAWLASVKERQAQLENAHRLDRFTQRRVVRDALVLATRVRRRVWEQASSEFYQPIASPMCTQFSTLHWHYQLANTLPGARRIVNAIPAGDFQDLVVMQHRGWTTLEHTPRDVVAQVSLFPQDDGNKYLRLSAAAQSKDADQSVIAAPLIWVNSPPVDVTPGQLFRIAGRLNVPHMIRGNEDGFLVFDSLGGPQLAHRVKSTKGWTEFVMYRAAGPQQTKLQVTLALSGLGEAWVDNLSISPLELQSGLPRTANLDQPDVTETIVP